MADRQRASIAKAIAELQAIRGSLPEDKRAQLDSTIKRLLDDLGLEEGYLRGLQTLE